MHQSNIAHHAIQEVMDYISDLSMDEVKEWAAATCVACLGELIYSE